MKVKETKALNLRQIVHCEYLTRAIIYIYIAHINIYVHKKSFYGLLPNTIYLT